MRRSIGLVRIVVEATATKRSGGYWTKRFALLALLLSALTGGLVAQTPQTLSGRVLDPTGAVIPRADVVIEQSEKPVAQLKTDGDGNFSFAGAGGEYEVTASSPGFTPIRRKGFTFVTDSATRVVMNVGSYSGPRVRDAETIPVVIASDAAIIDPVHDAAPLRTTSVAMPHAVVANPVRDGVTPWNLGVLAQGGVGATENRGSFRFFMAGVRAGKVLTATAGKGVLGGNFEYGVEVFPLWQSYTPVLQRQNCLPIAAGSTTVQCSGVFNVGGTFTGVSITPAILRWNFAGWGRVSPWLQGAGGVIWTNHKYPAYGGPPQYPPGTVLANPGGTISYNSSSANTSVWNFTPQFGVGMHYFVRPKRSVDFGANAIHISSASLGDRNPGVNASVQFTLGYSWWK